MTLNKKANTTRHAKGTAGRSLFITLIFFALLAIAVITEKLPMWLLITYLVVSAVTCLAYASDKSAAQKNGQRISEKTLHVLSLLAGWPGAMVAQQWLRHKTQKRPFRRVFWLTVLINLAALAGWLWA
ncbi:DUF1294 domain-containing protein [Vreelandella andesensis]|uniref:DUF1294 domain-containing protein n=1 Tax=Vreelandella andesensis TaxID=447567 RepID=A0A3S0W5W7_9GAMM|nr:DUF1294 domain-containing protein [Halomonas andesensis]RUR29531.1 DUF1294 domain-containing protein [Halomonas andesensis]